MRPKTKTYLLFLLIQVSFILLLSCGNRGEEPSAKPKGWDFKTCWYYANAIEIGDAFQLQYAEHAKSLLKAENDLGNEVDSDLILEKLKKLPGVNAVFISDADGITIEYPADYFDADFMDSLFNLNAASSHPKAPLMHRLTGGQVRFLEVRTTDNSYPSFTRFIHADTTDPSAEGAISLILNEDWLLAKVVPTMDSLKTESQQLLFWAPSPNNIFAEQSIGIIHRSDTLWWWGNKDIEIKNPPHFALGGIFRLQAHIFVRWVGE